MCPHSAFDLIFLEAVLSEWTNILLSSSEAALRMSWSVVGAPGGPRGNWLRKNFKCKSVSTLSQVFLLLQNSLQQPCGRNCKVCQVYK